TTDRATPTLPSMALSLGRKRAGWLMLVRVRISGTSVRSASGSQHPVWINDASSSPSRSHVVVAPSLDEKEFDVLKRVSLVEA
ncbi:hypothetical protein, partial [Stenotrophomonas maltophilia]|uniref:hypothetical protein n=1 Tax=Stenotrophomonas maltophilia TaxID=40324 RepID=UPI001954FAC1